MQSQSDAAAQFRAKVQAKIAEPAAAEPTVYGVASDTTPSTESSTTAISKAVDSQKPSSESPPAATKTTTAQTTSNKVCKNKKTDAVLAVQARWSAFEVVVVCLLYKIEW